MIDAQKPSALQLSMASDWHRITRVFAVRFDLRDGQLSVEWKPRMPKPQEKAKTLNRYRKARDEFLNAYAERTGATVGCVEMPL